jgi:hypothetical protein
MGGALGYVDLESDRRMILVGLGRQNRAVELGVCR